ncbi:adenylate/guanylate cyclase domain-containing protein [Flammeovirga kamogawensis]|nr:adenylate/guanylate cyclase domain-containing protein [Flammeovirga kamogawensis]
MFLKFKSNYRRKKYFKGWRLSFVAWYICIFLFFSIKVDTIQSFIEHNIIPRDSINVLSVFPMFLVTGIFSFIFCSISWNSYFFLELKSKFCIYKKSLINLLLLVFTFSFLLLFGELFTSIMYDKGLIFQKEISFRSIFIFLCYCIVIGTFINSIFQLKDILGPELFSSILKGNYHHPKEEDRIFMFLDLNNSTSIAEEIGHTQYSKFIQQTFKTITDSIANNDASIYQYVGDEVVLTWNTEHGIQDNKCVQVFYDIKKAIEKRRDYFMNNFGNLPTFKAGIHTGIVSSIQIGIIKKEIAYHGDVLNATARIQSECKNLGVPILISNSLSKKIGLKLPPLAEIKLRGRKSLMKLYTV